MQRFALIFLAFAILGTVVLVTAQNDNAPPPPLDESMTWMAGKWEGWSKGPMGEAKTYMETEVGLNGQFLLTNYKSVSDQGEYTGMGAITVMDGEIRGYWIDTFRSMSEGKGSMEGNTSTITWSSSFGPMTRITEKISNDHFKVTIKMTGPDGKPAEAHEEMKRVKS